jgi:hypothetical protein
MRTVHGCQPRRAASGISLLARTTRLAGSVESSAKTLRSSTSEFQRRDASAANLAVSDGERTDRGDDCIPRASQHFSGI